jgi:hypothetical protein
MGNDQDVYCPTCFAMPGELCRSKYLAHGRDGVTPVICTTHPARLMDSQRDFLRHSLARQLLALALMTLRGK